MHQMLIEVEVCEFTGAASTVGTPAMEPLGANAGAETKVVVVGTVTGACNAQGKYLNIEHWVTR